MQIDMIRGMVSNLEADIHAGKLTRDQAAKGLEIVSSIVNGVLFSNKELSFREKKAFNSMQKTITSLSEFVAKATQASVSNVGKVAEKAKIIQKAVRRHQSEQRTLLPGQINSFLQTELNGVLLPLQINNLSAQIIIHINSALSSARGKQMLAEGFWLSKLNPMRGVRRDSPCSFHLRYIPAHNKTAPFVEVTVIHPRKELLGKGGVKRVKKSTLLRIELKKEKGERRVIASPRAHARAKSSVSMQIAEAGVRLQSELKARLPADALIAEVPVILRKKVDRFIDMSTKRYSGTMPARYRPGEKLSVAGKERAFTLANRMEIFSQMAYTLKEIHKLGYVHRDFKADNVFLEYSNGLAKFKGFLADFDTGGEAGYYLGGSYGRRDVLSEHLYSTPFSDCYAVGMSVAETFLKEDFTDQFLQERTASPNEADIDFYFRRRQIEQMLKSLAPDEAAVINFLFDDIKQTERQKGNADSKSYWVKAYPVIAKKFEEFCKLHPEYRDLQSTRVLMRVMDESHSLVRDVIASNQLIAKKMRIRSGVGGILSQELEGMAKKITSEEVISMEEIEGRLSLIARLAENPALA